MMGFKSVKIGGGGSAREKHKCRKSSANELRQHSCEDNMLINVYICHCAIYMHILY